MEPASALLGLAVGAVVGGAVCRWWRRDDRRARVLWKRLSSQIIAAHRVEQEQVSADDFEQVERLCGELLRDQRRLTAVLDAMAEGLALLDGSSRVVLANPAFERMFHGVLGQPIPADAIPQEQAEAFAHAAATARSTRKVTSVEVRLNTTPPRDTVVTLTPYSDSLLEDGLILTAFDVTQRKRAEQVRTEFVANVSHELRTPLAAIRGYVETCLEPSQDGAPPPYARFLPIVYQHTLRLNALIEDLLILSRIESKGMQLRIGPLQLSSVVESTVATLSGAAEKKSVTLLNAMPPLLPDVKADPGAVERILLNLIENAIKYSDDGAEVQVTAQVRSDVVTVLVTDRGIGIPKEEQARIFERFYRVDKARSRKAGGTGLGLSIVKHLVQGQGGEVWVDSEPGRGSTFYFSLPVAHQTAPKERTPTRQELEAIARVVR